MSVKLQNLTSAQKMFVLRISSSIAHLFSARCLRKTMFSPKRTAPFFSILAFTLTLLYLHSQEPVSRWRDVPLIEIDGEGDVIFEEKALFTGSPLEESAKHAEKLVYNVGIPKPPGSNYTRALVMPRTSSEDVSWIETENLDVIPAIYTVDDPSSPLQIPANKGHEVMIYLTYIITHYDILPDISIFTHAHRHSWHNNALLNNDAAEMIRRLSSERVIRLGFMNLRCHWDPGCPDWMHPGVIADDVNKQEETLMVRCWAELFPGLPSPTLLAQPCCAQFAASRERIRAVPIERWRFWREWLLRTELNDFLSGRIWEYLWQVAFTGESFVCRDEHECYCDGYGICFEDGKEYKRFFERDSLRSERRTALDGFLQASQLWEENIRAGGPVPIGAVVEEPNPSIGEELKEQVEELEKEVDEMRSQAVRRGANAQVRAQVAGRDWRDGDGF